MHKRVIAGVWLATSLAVAQQTTPAMIEDINPGAASSTPKYIIKLPNGVIMFQATTYAHGAELWGMTTGVRDTVSWSDHDTLNWRIVPSALWYNVYRGTTFYSHVCFANRLAVASVVDLDVPDVMFYYLVAAVFAGGEEPLTDNVQRLTPSPCP